MKNTEQCAKSDWECGRLCCVVSEGTFQLRLEGWRASYVKEEMATWISGTRTFSRGKDIPTNSLMWDQLRMLEKEKCIEVSRQNSGKRHIVRCSQIIEILGEMGKDLRRHSPSDGKQTGCFNCSKWPCERCGWKQREQWTGQDSGGLRQCWGRSSGGERSYQDTVWREKRQGFLLTHLLMGLWMSSISWPLWTVLPQTWGYISPIKCLLSFPLGTFPEVALPSGMTCPWEGRISCCAWQCGWTLSAQW